MQATKNAERSSCCQGANLTSQKPITPSKKEESRGEETADDGQTKLQPSKEAASKSAKPGENNELPREDSEAQAEPEDASPKEVNPEEAKARRLRNLARRQKRAEEHLKTMFETSVDPYEKPLRWWEHPHVKYAFSHSAVKSRLESLMGTNIVRLTDRKYMLTLVAKIREEHENQQTARIQERKTRELMRTKTMILDRFMTIEEAQAEIRQYPLFQLYFYCDSLYRRPRRKRLPKKVRITDSMYRLLYPEKLVEDLGLIENQSLIEDEEEMEEDSGSQGEEEMDDKAIKKKRIAEPKNEYMFSQDEYDNLHYETDAVKKLKEIKSVNEMYGKAYEIVGNLFSLATNKPTKSDSDK